MSRVRAKTELTVYGVWTSESAHIFVVVVVVVATEFVDFDL